MSSTAWKGSLNLGLLSIPVKLFCAAREDRISLNQLHKPCNSRIKCPKSCPTCKRDVTQDEIVKGYEFSKGQYVTVADEELEAIAPLSDHIMQIESTCKISEIDAVYFGDSYYCVPEPAGAKAYTLLVKALRETKLVALARLSRSQRELVMVIRARGKGLIVHAMYYAQEVRSVAEFDIIAEQPVTPAESKLATKLLTSLSTEFAPESYEDGYQKRLADLLARKQRGETITITVTPDNPAPAVDMLTALQASLDQVPIRKFKTEK
jgi:DNA end-binding protein Ku